MSGAGEHRAVAPFATAAAAWLWVCAEHRAGAHSARMEQILDIIDGLFRQRELDLLQLYLLRLYGAQGRVPGPQDGAGDVCQWELTMAVLEPPLRACGLLGHGGPGGVV